MALLVTVAAVGQVAAGAPDPLNVALDNRDMNGAAKAIDKLAAQKRSRRRTDGALDSYYGRFWAAGAQGAVAEPYLLRAISAAGNRADRDELSFELARAREVDGFVGKAEADYRLLTDPDTVPLVRQNAILSLARLRLGVAPEESVSLLTQLTDRDIPTAARWEAQLLLSRAYAIQGKAAESRGALAIAWQEAPLAAVPVGAIAVTAMDMAIERAAGDDRRGEIGLISVGQSESRFGGVAQLPVCNSRLRPDDTVTIAIAGDAMQRPIYSVVRASRPGIAQLFTIPLAVARQQIGGSAIYVTLRCRSALDPNVRFAGAVVSNLPVWLAEQGYYPLLTPLDPGAGDPLTQLRAQVHEVEASAGINAPVLAPSLLQLSAFEAAQSRFGNAGALRLEEAKKNAERAFDILVKARAPAEVIEQARVYMTLIFAQNQNVADVAGPAGLEVIDAMASRNTTTPVQMLSAVEGMSGWQLRPTQRLALADRLVSFLDARKVSRLDTLRQAAELRRARILREIGTTAGMGERLAASGIAVDLCNSADRPPSIPPTAITLTSEDYPKDLFRYRVQGMTAIELSVDAGGKIESQRIIASQPARLFDAVATDKLKAVRLLSAQRSGTSVACRGMVQTVRWQIPFESNLAVPFFGFSPPEQ